MIPLLLELYQTIENDVKLINEFYEVGMLILRLEYNNRKK